MKGKDRMDFEEFSETVLKEIREKADGVFNAWLQTVVKNNGLELTGITTVAGGSNIGPCVYLDEYYKAYWHGEMGLEKVVGEVYGSIRESQGSLAEPRVTDFLDWEKMKVQIYPMLVNAVLNREMLGMMPHRMFLDLAVVYYIKVSGFTSNGTGTIRIHNQHMKMWGQDEENLYQAAGSNMRTDGRPSFESIEAVLERLIPGKAGLRGGGTFLGNTGIYVLTNRERNFGAAEILDRDSLEAISDKIGDGFVVLPSSVHEVIVFPSRKELEYGILAQLVHEVNTTQVSREEQLSDHVYVYSRSEGKLKIAV